MTDKRKIRNLKDIIRDELYGADIQGQSIAIDGRQVLCIPIDEVKNLAKKIVKRADIGPL